MTQCSTAGFTGSDRLWHVGPAPTAPLTGNRPYAAVVLKWYHEK